MEKREALASELDNALAVLKDCTPRVIDCSSYKNARKAIDDQIKVIAAERVVAYCEQRMQGLVADNLAGAES
jgi:hypothetical protein